MTYCFISLLTLSKFSQCFKILIFNIETVFLTNVVNKSYTFFILWKWSQERDQYISRNEFWIIRFYLPFKILLLVILFAILKIGFPFVCFFKTVAWKSVAFPIKSTTLNCEGLKRRTKRLKHIDFPIYLTFPTGIYLPKFNNKNGKALCETCPK